MWLSTGLEDYPQVIHNLLLTQNTPKTIENQQLTKNLKKLSTENKITYYCTPPKALHTQEGFGGVDHAIENKPPRQQQGKKTHQHISKKQKSNSAKEYLRGHKAA
jgi:hypothetical protein